MSVQPNISRGITCKGIMAEMKLTKVQIFLVFRIFWKTIVKLFCSFYKNDKNNFVLSSTTFNPLTTVLLGDTHHPAGVITHKLHTTKGLTFPQKTYITTE